MKQGANELVPEIAGLVHEYKTLTKAEAEHSPRNESKANTKNEEPTTRRVAEAPAQTKLFDSPAAEEKGGRRSPGQVRLFESSPVRKSSPRPTTKRAARRSNEQPKRAFQTSLFPAPSVESKTARPNRGVVAQMKTGVQKSLFDISPTAPGITRQVAIQRRFDAIPRTNANLPRLAAVSLEIWKVQAEESPKGNVKRLIQQWTFFQRRRSLEKEREELTGRLTEASADERQGILSKLDATVEEIGHMPTVSSSHGALFRFSRGLEAGEMENLPSDLK
ncbi:hypothetical protein AC249_AIPGENE4803, partial [Exaiptasia diaphana]